MTIHDICSTLYCTAYRRVSGGDVVASFTDSLPASALTDNGSVCTLRFTHGHNDFERLLASLGIAQTLKRWLTPPPRIRRHQPTASPARQAYLAGSSQRCCAELSLGSGRLGVGPLTGGPRHR
jgi:hypothetical protein